MSKIKEVRMDPWQKEEFDRWQDAEKQKGKERRFWQIGRLSEEEEAKAAAQAKRQFTQQIQPPEPEFTSIGDALFRGPRDFKLKGVNSKKHKFIWETD